jgi:hypothetical protein
VTLRTLVAMKRAAGRDQDRIDIENLRLRYPNDIPSDARRTHAD